jgi:hypothetical protein
MNYFARYSGLVGVSHSEGLLWKYFNCGEHAVVILARIYFDLSGFPGQWSCYIGVSHDAREEEAAVAEIAKDPNLVKLYHDEAMGMFPVLREVSY